ncbi:MAG: PKD domain-containing protein, partial [Bacteroidetes bacterium]|nr:PKD domain-containing protein [Bacteroidota bacterium]
TVLDTNGQPPFYLSWEKKQNSDDLTIPRCGKYYVYMRANINGCIQLLGPDSVEVYGPKVEWKTRNKIQCDANDKPVIFCEDLCDYKSTHLLRLYDFNDSYAPQCTTNTAKGIGVGTNCNFSNDASPQHKYSKFDCYKPKLIIQDTVNGCVDSVKEFITISKPVTSEDISTGRKGVYLKPNSYFQCKGTSVELKYDQILPTKPCKPLHTWIIWDSLAPNSKWLREDSTPESDTTNYSYKHNYLESYDTLGFVTIGFVAAVGYNNYFVTCDSAVSSRKMCYDTSWIHIRLSGGDARFTYTQDQYCQPSLVTVFPMDSIQDSILYSIWDFGKDTTITDTINGTPGKIPVRSHLFNKTGGHTITHTLVNYRGCKFIYRRYIFINHYADFEADTVVCVGADCQFKDSVYYYSQLQLAGFGQPVDSLWHSRPQVEKMLWDFGDGTYSIKFNPKHQYKTAGVYTVTLITTDSLGCVDTLVKPNYIHVIQVKPNFFTEKDKYLCGEYVHFLDSSYVIMDSILTKKGVKSNIKQYTWTWGDGKRPSNLKDPFHNFTSFGYVDVNLKIENANGCIDSITQKVFIKGPVATFDIVGDSVGCVPFTVHLKNTSLDSTCSNYLWLMGDSANTVINRDTNDDVVFTYTKPGIYDLYIVGQDSVYNPTTGNKYFCNS